MKRYGITEIFYTVQGEGMNAGRPAVFVRFAGCNLACDIAPGPSSPGGFRCDTEFPVRERLTAEEIVARVHALWPTKLNLRPWPMDVMNISRGVNPHPAFVVLTGGEPALQVDQPLMLALRNGAIESAIETNGTVDVNDLFIDWITVSPKITVGWALKQRHANEVKFVIAKGDPVPDYDLVNAGHHLLSPAADGDQIVPANVEYVLSLVQRDPRWRLSMQLHKILGVK